MVYLTSLEDKLGRLQVVRETTNKNLRLTAVLVEQTAEKRAELNNLWQNRIKAEKLASINVQIANKNLELARLKDEAHATKRDQVARSLALSHAESALQENIDTSRRIADAAYAETVRLLNMTSPSMYEHKVLEREVRGMSSEDKRSSRIKLGELQATESPNMEQRQHLNSLRQQLRQKVENLAEETAFLSQLHRLYPSLVHPAPQQVPTNSRAAWHPGHCHA